MTPRPIFVLLVCAISATVFALQPSEDNAIRLRARTFTPPVGIDTATQSLIERSPRELLHLIVQFRSPARTSTRDSITRELDVRS